MNVLSVRQTTDGGYILVGGSNNCASQGTSNGSPYLACAWVLKLSPAGAVDWQFVYSGAFQSSAAQVRQASDAGYVVAGSTQRGPITPGSRSSPRPEPVQWQRQIGSSPFAGARTVGQTSDGGYILAGSTGAIGSSSVLAVKLDAAGAGCQEVHPATRTADPSRE